MDLPGTPVHTTTVHTVFQLKPQGMNVQEFQSQLRDAARFCRYPANAVTGQRRKGAFQSVVRLLEQLDVSAGRIEAERNLSPLPAGTVEMSENTRDMFWLNRIRRDMTNQNWKKFNNQEPFADRDWLRVQLENFRAVLHQRPDRNSEMAIRFLTCWTAVVH